MRHLKLTHLSHSSQRGLTLLEMLISVTVLTILLTLVGPTTQHILTSNRVVSDINGLSSVAQRGQFTAVNEQLPVIMCPTEDYSKCVSNWSNAKMLFIDNNGNGERNDNEALIVATDPLNTNNLVKGITGPLVFDPSGTLDKNTVIIVCPNSGDERYASGIILSFFGRIATAIDSNGDGFKEDADGNALSCT